MQQMFNKSQRQHANEYIEQHKLRVAHFRGFDDYDMPELRGGMTFVWKHRKGETLATIATSLCNTKDTFCKDTGRILATNRFEAGNVIQLPVINYISCWHMLLSVFN
jgi:hypothetical protein